MRRVSRATLVAVLLLTVVFGQVFAASSTSSSQKDVGDESHELMESLQTFVDQRAAPASQPPAAAWPAAVSYARNLPSTGGSWKEIGPYNYQSDDPRYVDPAHSNSGGGSGVVSGRITALAATKDGKTVFAGAAGGGVWKSINGGQSWVPLTDTQETLSTGALLIDEQKSGYTVYVGTGEANTNSDSYAGVGVLVSKDGGASWARLGGDTLVGATIYRLVLDPTNHNRILAATSRGLYIWDGSRWTRTLGSGTSITANMVTDLVFKPGTNGKDVIAAIGWRGGAATNGLYESLDGGLTFTQVANPQGYVPGTAQGRVSLAYSADGSKLYAVVQDPILLNQANSKTILAGVYVSNNGTAQGPFTKIAESSKLADSNSAMKVGSIGRGYQPGIQAWYNQFIVVDPTDANHLYLGLEEVYETTNGGSSWTTIGAYWNFSFPCFSYNPFPGTCPTTTHSDQHAAVIANGTLWVGNDGGVWSRPLTNHQPGSWTNLNATLNTLQFYYGAATKGQDGKLTFLGGLQDNGTAKVVLDASGKQIEASQPFGGDGGDVIVDPTNPNNLMTEYTGLTIAKSRDGGKTWTDIIPNDPNPRFIAPFMMDPTNSNHLVAGGQYVWDSTKGFDTECNSSGCDWQPVYNQGSGKTTTALGTAGGVTYAAWCGPCNPNMDTGTGVFKSGIATNYGGTWHNLASVPLTTRYPAGIDVDTANPAHAYVVYSGYSRRWIVGPYDAGVGHVFETKDGGVTWKDISSNIVDAPADDVIIVGTHLVVATDVGVFVSDLSGTSWSRLGAGLPNVIVDDLAVSSDGKLLIAATHGRGLWTFPVSSLP